MIKKLNPHLYAADKNDRCEPDIIFIRQSPTELNHICQRESRPFGGEIYKVGAVKFDYTLGSYHCTNQTCWAMINLADVWSDPELTGWEAKA